MDNNVNDNVNGNTSGNADYNNYAASDNGNFNYGGTDNYNNGGTDNFNDGVMDNYVSSSCVNNDIPPKKSKSKLLKVLIPVVAIVAVLAVVCVANASSIKKFISKTFGSPTEYYKSIEKENIDKLAGQYATSYDNLMYAVSDLNNKTYSLDIGVKVEDGAAPYMSMLSSATDYDFSWAKQAGISADIISNDGVYGINGKVSVNEVDIASINAAYSSDKKTAYLGIPELTDKSAAIPADTGVDIKSVVATIDSLLKELPEDNTIRDIIVRYGAIIIDSIEEVETEDTELTASGITQSCTAYVAKVDYNLLKKMSLDILNALKNDEDIKTLLTKNVDAVKALLESGDIAVFGGLSEAIGDKSGNEVYDSFISSVDELILTIETSGENDEMTGTMSTYINGSDEVIGRIIELNGLGKLEYKTPFDGDNFGIEYRLYTADSGMDTPVFDITGTGTLSNGLMNCDFEATAKDISSGVGYSIKDMDVEAAMKGEMKGTISYDLGNVLSENGVSGMDGLAIDMVIDSTREQQKVDVGVRLNSTSLATISIAFGIGSGKAIEVPADSSVMPVNSEEEIMSYISTMKFDSVIESLKTAGVDSKITDMISQYTSLLSMGL